MKLDKYLELANKHIKCSICTYSDFFEDMIQITNEKGELVWVHKECQKKDVQEGQIL